MDELRLRQALEGIAESEVPEGDIDLWERVEDALGPGEGSQIERGGQRFPSRRFAFAGILVVLVIVLGLSLVPGVRAAAGEVIQRFGLVLVGEGEPRQERFETPSTRPTVGGYEIDAVPLEQAQAQVPFPIPRPMWLPEFLEFRHARVGTGPYTGAQTPPISVVLGFEPKEGFPELEDGGMFLQIYEGRISGGYAIPEQTAQQIEAGGQSFTFAQGAWRMGGGWNRDADAGLLTWRDEDFTYVIGYSGLGLDADDLIRIALSVRAPEE